MPKKIFIPAVSLVIGISISLVSMNSNLQEFLKAMIADREIITLTNEKRKDREVGVLKENLLLKKAAQAKADDMAEHSYFGHDTQDGQRFTYFIKEAGYDYQFAGENLAVRFMTAENTIEAWMESEKHRENILNNRFSEIGVGVAEGMYKGKAAIFVVQEFGQPRSLHFLPEFLHETKILGQSNRKEVNLERKSMIVKSVPNLRGLFDLSKNKELSKSVKKWRRERVYPRVLNFMIYLSKAT